MNEKKHLFNFNGIRKAILILSGCILLIVFLAGSAYIYQFLRTQQQEINSLFQQIKEQESRITVLSPSVEELKKSLDETRAKEIIQQKTQEHLGLAIKALETAHESLKTETRKMKGDEKEWLKEALISLSNLEAKINETSTHVLSLESGAVNSNKEIKKLKEQVKSLRALLNKIVDAMPASSPDKQAIQKAIHPELFKK